MGKINLLDDQIANQIAAGEVVERPASIVKELVENSIDAGSTKIEIEIREGGLTSIKVKDNGEGIAEDDVEKAFFRHATSKLKDSKDLFRIKTLGFRGEALPSIAAVSSLTLKTSANNYGRGIEVKLEGGKLFEKKEIAFVKGTEIIVENVFYNTPARLKYMKSLQTELGHIIDYVNRLSLAYPNIAISLVHNGRLILRTTGNGKVDHVLGAIYGTSVAKKMIEVKGENLDFKLSGFISKPELTRANKNHITIFVNGRYIKNYLLNQALIRGYKTSLMVNRFPIAVLHLSMDPTLVDVNVHPAKLEARFSKESELIKFIEQAIDKTLNRHTFIPEPIKVPKPEIKYHKAFQSAFDLTIDYQDKVDDTQRELPKVKENKVTLSSKNESEENQNDNIDDNLDQSLHEVKFPPLEPIGQFQGTYIIAQNDEGLYLIDQHAAHERIYYEKNLALLNDEIIASQELLVPITIDYSKSEIEQILSKIEIIRDSGFEIELFGQQTLIIRSIPKWIPDGQEKDFIEKIIQMVLQKDEVVLEELRKELIANTSCKTSIKANQFLTKREMETLLEQLRQTVNPFNCPHGRPIIIHFSNYDIKKMFKRVI
ncbi:hypothetical protein BHF71_06125 [Vulcanibacillus modesticaldus]|uniref:DNA mismatch repair protein MutL n=1 Tax=Vulcanibacillus modesticaldus TaxID=337097 RepID=A0A1D2YX31_9BACI|nr:DNA mismatch repair endonuclease MutL [Vulcanibacillus modesticaldus]OEG00177.1 hypothetical protein BHF71_06125 [Vulcanibacillus modesticaldus]